ncbi:hypothetical protein [Mycoplasma suis]|uniref:Uncharacterized protein n=2 Tax=Mycoplasma suis TaxID=57372 RepID=F0QQN1_MYCSL|nr:hypothetical protein [Mycoplasma suis]ADX97801.1 hypothetical protein MSU_0257 [Mycoplasma suis str. Illinois]CBZ40299.1 hypothetical protein MSUIS_02060 [Mycoplasma suis KI3806]
MSWFSSNFSLVSFILLGGGVLTTSYLLALNTEGKEEVQIKEESSEKYLKGLSNYLPKNSGKKNCKKIVDKEKNAEVYLLENSCSEKNVLEVEESYGGVSDSYPYYTLQGN